MVSHPPVTIFEAISTDVATLAAAEDEAAREDPNHRHHDRTSYHYPANKIGSIREPTLPTSSAPADAFQDSHPSRYVPSSYPSPRSARPVPSFGGIYPSPVSSRRMPFYGDMSQYIGSHYMGMIPQTVTGLPSPYPHPMPAYDGTMAHGHPPGYQFTPSQYVGRAERQHLYPVAEPVKSGASSVQSELPTGATELTPTTTPTEKQRSSPVHEAAPSNTEGARNSEVHGLPTLSPAQARNVIDMVERLATINKSLHPNSRAGLQAQIDFGLIHVSCEVRLADAMSREQAITALEVFSKLKDKLLQCNVQTFYLDMIIDRALENLSVANGLDVGFDS
ncbi:MAG: hypothetical protein Q9208_005237 [Pyrenodesmia sp. 3 TL-2023]